MPSPTDFNLSPYFDDFSEAKNFRNDGWVQLGYREKYKKALKQYIMTYPSLDSPPRT